MIDVINKNFKEQYLSKDNFGVLLSWRANKSIAELINSLEAGRQNLLERFYQANGLMIIRGLDSLRDSPELLVRISRLFGPEVENYWDTLTSKRFYHGSVAEILVLSNQPPCSHPPPPKSDLINGKLPTQFPHQQNWHTDQSYRRPPPDISLLYAITLPPSGQGQTFYSNCTAAFDALDSETQLLVENRYGIHSPSWIGRSREAVRNNEKPVALLPHQLPQRHPLVRHHPVTGKPSLYICEEKQMDYVDGPISGLSCGHDGEGAQLIHRLLKHATGDEFVYVHQWQPGDLVIADNRNLLHCASWYDADRYPRLMWRTTVSGNPGEEYAGESKSWIPQDGSEIMAGMENV